MDPITPSTIQPSSDTATIHLVREELKSRRFFEGLRDLGLDDAFYQTDLLDLIMARLGLSPESQEQYSFCVSLLQKHSARVNQDADELLSEARCAYAMLQDYARREACRL
jgi:hypothetical protein